ncbi:hypothetical protein EGW08_022872 [Elysia chlorotica]|uniref:Methyltransferase domain-containing protein n=1 Tax=Elysia chlorotica TaxID=188477 RepID=A0A3S0Z4R6_ELYCH|nr:hypothetical protein EGW08_022872 [Elysia chlorotica]
MENTIGLDSVHAAIRQVQNFLTPYLGIANTHGAEFLSDDHWHNYVSPTAQSSLLELSCEDLVNLSSLTIQDNVKESNSVPSAAKHSKEVPDCARQKDEGVEDLRSFISEAEKCYLDRLDVLTSLDTILQRKPSTPDAISVVSEAMSEKKIHEVGVMVDAISFLYKITQSDLVVDVGSGKGYFASEMSLRHKIPVVGFDSRDTNTHGASQRDKKLAKKWVGLERRKRLKQNSSSMVTDEKERTHKNQSECPPNVTLTCDVHTETSKTAPGNGQGEDMCDESSSSVSSLDTMKTFSDFSSLPESSRSFQQETTSCNLYTPVTLYVHPKMDLYKVIRQEAPQLGYSVPPRLFLSGLHTCGSLAVTTLNLFLQDPNVVGLCCVGCCYQLMEEFGPDNQQEEHFPISVYGKRLGLQLGRNARNLASQSVHRIRASGQLQGGDFFWRALLNVLLSKLGIDVPERIIGMRGLNKKSSNFQDYAAAAFKKLGLSDQLPDVCELQSLEESYKDAHAKMSAFFQLKLVLAPVIETLILLDRLAFLLEQESVDKAHLVQLFDPVTSPRCFAIIAWKGLLKDESLDESNPRN